MPDPAFPVDEHFIHPDGWSEQYPGLSRRDYFAAHIRLEIFHDNNAVLAEKVAAELMGEPPPNPEYTPILHCMKWWAAAEAKSRYFFADAMLKASEGKI